MNALSDGIETVTTIPSLAGVQPLPATPTPHNRRSGQVPVVWNKIQKAYAEDGCIHHLFEAQVARSPNAVALVYQAEQLSYHELNRRANQLAHYLQALGVGPETLVGICLERSLDLVLSILAVWKAGGAYVPLDPTYPPDRLAFILADAQASVLLTATNDQRPTTNDGGDKETRGQGDTDYTTDNRQRTTDTLHPLTLDLCRDWTAIGTQPESAPVSAVRPDNLAYVIYTSGSTGRPKGVLIPHRGLGNVQAAQRRVFELDFSDRVLQFSSPNFDASVFELVMALGTGATLHLIPREQLLPGPELLRALRVQGITTLTISPSALAALPPAALPALRTLALAGEACPADLVAR